MLSYKSKKSVAIFGIDINKINSTSDKITSKRVSLNIDKKEYLYYNFLLSKYSVEH